jgi:uncharacterized protein (TIGR00661 family)
MNQPLTSPKILVAPLDWGLGHATRCIPIIKELIQGNCTVLIAAFGKIKTLLEAEFPSIRFLDLPGYNIEYAASGWGLAAKIVVQIPKLLSAIKEEHNWLKKIVEEEGVDAIISDNRYGLYHPKIRSVFITHQLLIKAPVKLAEDILQDINYRHINRFDECWVPDAAEENNLAGALSHPPSMPEITVHYLGAVSRFGNSEKGIERDYLLILLSGPEPQRSLLEKNLLEDLKEYKKQVVFVRGLPGEEKVLQLADNIAAFNHLPAAELEEKIKSASFVIARCGYSTVMDLAALKKRSILIPTPGQTEQEYLARHLMEENFALCIAQKKFRLKIALELAQSFNYNLSIPKEGNLKLVIQTFIDNINKRNQK